MSMQAYLNQEFPLGLADLRLHPVRVVRDPAEERRSRLPVDPVLLELAPEGGASDSEGFCGP